MLASAIHSLRRFPFSQDTIRGINSWRFDINNNAEYPIFYSVVLNEPLSALQKGCEQLYYSELLNKAEECNDENMRILYVAAFAVSTYSVN